MPSPSPSPSPSPYLDAVEPLYPPELASLSIPEFMAALPSLDEAFAAKIAAAAADGNVLRYAASVKPPSGGSAGSLVVGLVAVPASSPLGTLTGSDNLVEIHTGTVRVRVRGEGER